MERYTNTNPISASSLDWLMGLVASRRQELDAILGFQVAETLLHTLGRVQTTPDSEMVDEGVTYQRFTGD